MSIRATLSMAFSLMLLQRSWASRSFVATFQGSSKKQNTINGRRLDDFGEEVCDPTPEFIFEGEPFADFFSQERQPVCDCGRFGTGLVDLPGFFADNPVPANEDELQSWLDIFNIDFLGEFKFEDEYGCKNQCSFCLDGTDACVLLDVAQGGSGNSIGFEVFTIEEALAIAADPEGSAGMVDFRVASSMEGQFFRVCYTLTEGKTGTVCLTTGERLFAPFCTLSVDGVDCTSCETPPDDGSIVADCSNIASAPAVIDSSMENLSGVYAPLAITASIYAFEDSLPGTFGSCPVNQETESPVPAPGPVTTMATDPPAPPPVPDTANTATPDETPAETSASTYFCLASLWTVLVASATFVF